MVIIDPHTLEDHPLVLKTVADGDFSVLCSGHLVGRMRSDIAGGTESWLWTVTGP
jgi:hypothetical protein